jgi:hypothetical protein
MSLLPSKDEQTTGIAPKGLVRLATYQQLTARSGNKFPSC